MQTISIVLTWCMGHRIHHHEGKCKRLHGHTYSVELTLTGTVEHDFICDFNEVKGIVKAFLDDEVDHKTMIYARDPILPYLRNVIPDDLCIVSFVPTVENISKWLYLSMKTMIPKLSKVTVSESPTTFASYSE